VDVGVGGVFPKFFFTTSATLTSFFFSLLVHDDSYRELEPSGCFKIVHTFNSNLSIFRASKFDNSVSSVLPIRSSG
jgi:hypothetical protein